MRHDDWDRASFFIACWEAQTWANRSVGFARNVAAPLPDRQANDMRQLAKAFRECAAELDAIAGKGGDTTDHITAMAKGE